ncbi:MAG TPA: TadE/TadG family type IV pilus assembly protein [Stellaceae bacterium]|nr:TadE/TadG family type IV pilus assembly protein [Stellaceae bacterium]
MSAVEFALVAPIFLLTLLSIVEFGLTLFTQTVLDGAARDAARLVRTGQVQGSGKSTATQVAAFQAQLCSELSVLMGTATCTTKVLAYVNQFANFGAVAFTAPCTANTPATGIPPAGTCPFSAGAGRQIVGVQVRYARPSIIGWAGEHLAPSGFTNLTSTVVFQNEPF